MKLTEYLDKSKLEKAIADGYINVRQHPTLPLRILNYSPSAQFDNHWPHEVCACRGLIVDADDNIVARPQYKFFNLGQRSTIMGAFYNESEVHEELMVDSNYLLGAVSDWKSELTITRKMDGMMGVLWQYDGQWGIATRGSFESDGAKFATEKWQKFVKYGATEFVPSGWTLVFEVIAKHLRIVVPYEWEGLCLLTAVNNETGEEMPYEALKQVWVHLNQYSRVLDADGNSVPGKPWCRLVEKFDTTIDACLTDNDMKEEGYVVAVNRMALPPIKVKIKLEEYKRLHRILTGVTPQMIWEELGKPMSPWLDTECVYDRNSKTAQSTLSVPHEFAEWVRGWHKGLTQAFHEKLLQTIKAVEHMGHYDNPMVKNDSERKAYLANIYGKDVAGYAMQLYRGRVTDTYADIWKSVRPHGKDDRFYVEGSGE